MLSLQYWEYFLSIESDLARCGRFVEFTQDNFNTYSVEFARIIMAAASEFDAVAKHLCKLIEPSNKRGNIKDYFPIITTKYQNFTDCIVRMQRYKLDFRPWNGWTSENGPEWWSKGYNKIKHERNAYFYQANLQNSLLAVSGLFVAILYFNYTISRCIPIIEPSQEPKLFQLGNYDPDYYPTSGLVYNLPI